MQYERPRASCSLCPLAGKRKILSELVASESPAQLVVIGDYPGDEETRDGKPFTSPYGKLINWVMYQVGIRRSNVYLGYSVLCQPTRGSTLEIDDSMCNCRAGLRDELNALCTKGTRVVLALGSTVLQSLGNTQKLDTVRGSVYKVIVPSGTLLVIPTYTPSEIMNKTWKRSGGGTADRMVTWLADWKKAKKISENPDGYADLLENFNLEPTVKDVEQFVNKVIQDKLVVAVDTETTGLSYDDHGIVVIGLATSTEDAICVPIQTLHGESYFKDNDWIRVKESLRTLFYHAQQIYQNSFFDVPRLRKMGFEIPYERIEHDTMILHHTIAAEAPHDLGFITSVYGSTPYWKDDFKNRTCGILEMDQLTMRRYNLRDCVVLHQIVPPMLRDLGELGLNDLYRDEVRPLIAPIMDMTMNGIGINLSRVLKYKDKLEQMVSERDTLIHELGNLPREFNLNSDSQVRYFLFGSIPSTFKKIDEMMDKIRVSNILHHEKSKILKENIEEIKVGQPKNYEKKLVKMHDLLNKLETPKPQTGVEKEIFALKVVRDFVKPLYTLTGYAPPMTESNVIAIDKMALLSYKIALTNRLAVVRGFKQKDGTEEEASIHKLLNWLDALSEMNLLTKLLSTYTKYQPWKDGRIHPYWKMHGTASGRLASSEPNLQNLPLPRDNSEDIRNPIRDFFVAKPGHKFVSSDYVNLEAQLLAFETLDPDLCAVFEKGFNLHDVNTKAFFGIDETSPMWSLLRKAAKVIYFACICYGGTPWAIHRKIMAEIPSLRITAKELEESVMNWMNSHPPYRAWEQKVRYEAKKNRLVRTSFGRVRIFLGNDSDIEKEALNHMIQSSGASLVNRATIRIWKHFKEHNMKSQIVLQVHDQLVIEAPDDEVEQVKLVMVTELQRPFIFRGVERSIPCDCTVGDDFGKV